MRLRADVEDKTNMLDPLRGGQARSSAVCLARTSPTYFVDDLRTPEAGFFHHLTENAYSSIGGLPVTEWWGYRKLGSFSSTSSANRTGWEPTEVRPFTVLRTSPPAAGK